MSFTDLWNPASHNPPPLHTKDDSDDTDADTDTDAGEDTDVGEDTGAGADTDADEDAGSEADTDADEDADEDTDAGEAKEYTSIIMNPNEDRESACMKVEQMLQDIHSTIGTQFESINQRWTKDSLALPPMTFPSKESVGNNTPRSITSDMSFGELMDTWNISKKRDKIVYDEDADTNPVKVRGWTKQRKHRIRMFMWRLKFNRIVTHFYLNHVRKNEEYWSWLIIVISTITSGITVANNVDDSPSFIPHYHVAVKIALNISSMSTALIAAWIKKKRFVEKINEIDKYLLGLNHLCEELEIQLGFLETDRLSYGSFKKKYVTRIIQYATTHPLIPPEEWKSSVKEITLQYPELIDPDSSEMGKLWPWYGDLIEQRDGDTVYHVRKSTNFMKHMKKTNADKIISSCCRKKRDPTNIYK
jgi:hypothetical protein